MISRVDDLSFWREQGQRNCVWLPPVVCPPSEYRPATARRYDLAFVASLNSPNNTEALRWLTEEVLPEVRRLRGAVSVVVAGSRPTRSVRTLCDAVAGLDLVADPPSTWAVYQLGRVLVNPAQSGSGVQIKTVEMLHTDAPIVCTPVGAQGLPEIGEEYASNSGFTECLCSGHPCGASCPRGRSGEASGSSWPLFARRGQNSSSRDGVCGRGGLPLIDCDHQAVPRMKRLRFFARFRCTAAAGSVGCPSRCPPRVAQGGTRSDVLTDLHAGLLQPADPERHDGECLLRRQLPHASVGGFDRNAAGLRPRLRSAILAEHGQHSDLTAAAATLRLRSMLRAS